jgi:hypothetical protein
LTARLSEPGTNSSYDYAVGTDQNARAFCDLVDELRFIIDPMVVGCGSASSATTTHFDACDSSSAK